MYNYNSEKISMLNCFHKAGAQGIYNQDYNHTSFALSCSLETMVGNSCDWMSGGPSDTEFV